MLRASIDETALTTESCELAFEIEVPSTFNKNSVFLDLLHLCVIREYKTLQTEFDNCSHSHTFTTCHHWLVFWLDITKRFLMLTWGGLQKRIFISFLGIHAVKKGMMKRQMKELEDQTSINFKL